MLQLTHDKNLSEDGPPGRPLHLRFASFGVFRGLKTSSTKILNNLMRNKANLSDTKRNKATGAETPAATAQTNEKPML